jgi:adenine specific DNA methylase Mod
MKSGFLLNVVVRKCAAIFELLASKDKTLLIWGNTFLILDLSLHVVNSVAGLNVKSDSLAGESLDENLHTTTEAEDQMKSRFLLNVVVRKGAAIFELLASKDEALLIWGDTFLVLDLSLHVVNSIAGLNVKSDSLAGESLDENLHTTTEAEDQMKSGFLLNVVVRKGAAIFELLASKDEALLIWGNTFLVLDLSLHVVNSIAGFNVKSDSLASESLYENLHFLVSC